MGRYRRASLLAIAVLSVSCATLSQINLLSTADEAELRGQG